MFRATRNELYRIFTGKKIYILSFIMITLSVVMGLVLKAVNSQTTEMPIPLSKLAFPMQFFSIIGYVVFPILIIIMVSGFFSDDYRDGTMKQTLLGAVTRSELLISKIFAVILSNLFILCASIISSSIVGGLLFREYDIFIFNNTTLAFSNGIRITLYYYGTMLGLGTTLGIVVLALSLLIKNSGTVVGISMGLYLFQFFIQNLANNLRPYLLSSYFAIGNVFLRDNFDNAIKSLLVACIAYISIPLIISFINIVKRDILY